MLCRSPTTHHSTNRNVIIGSVVGGACGFLLLFALGLWLLRRRPNLYLNISPFTSTSSIPTQQSDSHPSASSGLLAFANATSRSRESAGKRAAIAHPPTTSQIPQARPVTASPANGSSSGAVQAGASPAAGASRPDTIGVYTRDFRPWSERLNATAQMSSEKVANPRMGESRVKNTGLDFDRSLRPPKR